MLGTENAVLSQEGFMKITRTRAEEDDSCQAYHSQIKNYPLLSFEEELELSRLVQKGDSKARKKLIESNLRLVTKIAQSYYKNDIALMDLIQEGNVGLMRAVDKYDHLRKVRFSTYAGWWIRQAITRFLYNKQRTIRLPHRKEETLRKIQRAYHVLSQRNSRQPKNEEIAKEINTDPEEVASVMNMSSNVVSLGTENDNDSSALINIHEDYTYCPERALMNKALRDEAKRVLTRLKSRERRILTWHLQLNGGERHTLKKIGSMMGISPETVRQIEMKALRKMRVDADDLQIYYEG